MKIMNEEELKFNEMSVQDMEAMKTRIGFLEHEIVECPSALNDDDRKDIAYYLYFLIEIINQSKVSIGERR